MKKKLGTFLAGCAACLLLNQCATKQDMQQLDFRMRYLDSKLVEMDKALHRAENNPEVARKSMVDKVQQVQASTGESLERLQSDLLKMFGDIDEANHNLTRLKEESGKKQAENELQLQELRESFGQLQTKLENVENELNEIKIARSREASERALAAARAAEQAKNQAAGIKEMAPRKQKIDKRTSTQDDKAGDKADEPGSSLYKEALALYEAKRYKEAYHSFGKYLDSFARGSMAPNARYWLAESLYAQEEYALAILEYEKVFEEFPRHEKAPAALFKEALAFEKRKDNDIAKYVYGKLLDNYPDSEQAAAAKKRLKNLK